MRSHFALRLMFFSRFAKLSLNDDFFCVLRCAIAFCFASNVFQPFRETIFKGFCVLLCAIAFYFASNVFSSFAKLSLNIFLCSFVCDRIFALRLMRF